MDQGAPSTSNNNVNAHAAQQLQIGQQHAASSTSLADGPQDPALPIQPGLPQAGAEASFASGTTEDSDVIHLDLTGNQATRFEGSDSMQHPTSFIMLPGGFLVPVDTGCSTLLVDPMPSASTQPSASTSPHQGQVTSGPGVPGGMPEAAVGTAEQAALPGPRRQRTNPGDAPASVSDSSVFSPAELTQLIHTQAPVHMVQAQETPCDVQATPQIPMSDGEDSTEVELEPDEEEEEEEEEEELLAGSTSADALPTEPIRLFAIPLLSSTGSPTDQPSSAAHASPASTGSPAAGSSSSSAAAQGALHLPDNLSSTTRTTLAALSVSARYSRDDEPDSPPGSSPTTTHNNQGQAGSSGQGVSRSADFPAGGSGQAGGARLTGDVGSSLKEAGSAPAAAPKVNLGGTLRGPHRISMSTLKEMALQQEQRQREAAQQQEQQPAAADPAPAPAAASPEGPLASVVSSLLNHHSSGASSDGAGDAAAKSQPAAEAKPAGQRVRIVPPAIATSQSVPVPPSDGGLPPSPFASPHANSSKPAGPKLGTIKKRASKGALLARKSAPDLANHGLDSPFASPFAIGAATGRLSSNKPMWLTPPSSSTSSPNRPSSPVAGAAFTKKRSSSRQASPALSSEHTGSAGSEDGDDGDELAREQSVDSDPGDAGRAGSRAGRHPSGSRGSRGTSRLHVASTETDGDELQGGDELEDGQQGGSGAGFNYLTSLTSYMHSGSDGGRHSDDDDEEEDDGNEGDAEEVEEEEVEEGYDDEDQDEEEEEEDAFEVDEEEDMPNSQQMKNELSNLKEELNAQKSVSAGLRGELRKYTLLTAQLDAQLHGLKQAHGLHVPGSPGGVGTPPHAPLLTASTTAVNLHAAKLALQSLNVSSQAGGDATGQLSSPKPVVDDSSGSSQAAEAPAPPPSPPVIGLQADKRLTLYREAITGSMHTACGAMLDELQGAQEVLRGKEVLDSGSEKVILIKIQKIIQSGADATRHVELLQQDIAISHNKQGAHGPQSSTGSLVTDAIIRQSLPPSAFNSDHHLLPSLHSLQEPLSPAHEDPQLTAELAAVKAENAQLKQEVDALTAQLAASKSSILSSPFAALEGADSVHSKPPAQEPPAMEPALPILSQTSSASSNLGPTTPSPKVLHASHDFSLQDSTASGTAAAAAATPWDISSTKSGSLLSMTTSGGVLGGKGSSARGLGKPLSLKARADHQADAAGWQLERQMLLTRLAELEDQVQAQSGAAATATLETAALQGAGKQQPTTPTQSTPVQGQQHVGTDGGQPDVTSPAAVASPVTSPAAVASPVTSPAAAASPTAPEQPSAAQGDVVVEPAPAEPPAAPELVTLELQGSAESTPALAPAGPGLDSASVPTQSSTPAADAATLLSLTAPVSPLPAQVESSKTVTSLRALEPEQSEQGYKQQLAQYEEQIRELQVRLAAAKASAKGQQGAGWDPASLTGASLLPPHQPAALMSSSQPPVDLLSQLDSWRSRYLALQERFHRAQSQLPGSLASSTSNSVSGAVSAQEEATSSSYSAPPDASILHQPVPGLKSAGELEPAQQRLTTLLQLATAVDNKLKYGGAGQAAATGRAPTPPAGGTAEAGLASESGSEAQGAGFEVLVRKLEKQIQRVLLTALETSQRGKQGASTSPPPGSVRVAGVAEMKHELENVGQENLEMRRQVAAQTNLNAQLALQLQALEQRLAAIQSSQRPATSPRPGDAVAAAHQTLIMSPSTAAGAATVPPPGSSPYRGEAGSVRLPMTFDELYRHQTLQRFSARPPPPS